MRPLAFHVVRVIFFFTIILFLLRSDAPDLTNGVVFAALEVGMAKDTFVLAAIYTLESVQIELALHGCNASVYSIDMFIWSHVIVMNEKEMEIAMVTYLHQAFADIYAREHTNMYSRALSKME
jgi:hypothetical protein